MRAGKHRAVTRRGRRAPQPVPLIGAGLARGAIGGDRDGLGGGARADRPGEEVALGAEANRRRAADRDEAERPGVAGAEVGVDQGGEIAQVAPDRTAIVDGVGGELGAGVDLIDVGVAGEVADDIGDGLAEGNSPRR